MNLIKLFAVATAMFAGITVLNAQTADEIMEKHEKAIGGMETWNKINSLKMKGNISQGGMDINITQNLLIGKAMRTDIVLMGMSGFRIITNTEGWSYMPFTGSKKIDTLKPDVVKAAQKQLDAKSQQYLDYKTSGVKIELTGRDTLNSIVCYKMKFTDKDGNETTAYLDCNTYYLLRTETKIKTDDQEQEVSMSFNNYKKLDEGITFPMSVTMQGAEMTFTSVELNKPIDETIFKPVIPKAAETEKK